MPPVLQSKPSGEKRRICATPVSVAPTPSLPQQQRSTTAVSAGGSIDLDQAIQPPAPQDAKPAGVPDAQEPGEAQKPRDMLAQHSSAAVSPGASQEPQGSNQQREANKEVGNPACSESAGDGLGGSHFSKGQSQAEPAEDVSAVQDSGEHLVKFPNAHGLLSFCHAVCHFRAPSLHLLI